MTYSSGEGGRLIPVGPADQKSSFHDPVYQQWLKDVNGSFFLVQWSLILALLKRALSAKLAVHENKKRRLQ